MKTLITHRTGLVGDSFDGRDFIATGDDIALGAVKKTDVSPLVEIKNGGKRVDLANIPFLNQGKGTVTCTPYSGTQNLMIMQILLKKNKMFWLNPEEQVVNQKEYPATWVDGVGDYLNAPLKAMRKNPLTWWNPETKKFEYFGIKSYKVVDISLWKQYLRMGYPLIGGGRFARTPIDKNNYLKIGNVFGHAMSLVGFDDIQQRFIFLDPSGFTRTGKVFIDYKEAPELFRAWLGIPN